jgi:membrane associated rhomboid family serine protease
MENHQQTPTNYSLFYILALITGVLTAWVITCSVLIILLGAVLGLLSAAFFVNVLVKDREA